MIIAPCPYRACFKIPAIVQMSFLYFAIVEVANDEPALPPPMIKTLLSVWVVA